LTNLTHRVERDLRDTIHDKLSSTFHKALRNAKFMTSHTLLASVVP